MKKTIAILWLFICMTPAWGNAGELTVGPAAETIAQVFPGESDPSRLDPGIADTRARDEELLQITGHGLDGLTAALSAFPGKMEMASARIKLWDEADRGVRKLDLSTGGGLLQSITVSGRGNK